jgi:ribosomal protein S18 acetylase RimI-like enzyme
MTALRLASDDDLSFLFRVFAATRQREVDCLPWGEAEKDAFLRQQFAAQHQHYRAQYPEAEFLVVERDGVAIGRLYVHRDIDEVHVLDVALLPEHRGAGFGTTLFQELLAQARDTDSRVTLYVEASNPARRLYARLGFVMIEQGPVYDLLEWRAPAPAVAC